jgi:hypothetical protein
MDLMTFPENGTASVPSISNRDSEPEKKFPEKTVETALNVSINYDGFEAGEEGEKN